MLFVEHNNKWLLFNDESVKYINDNQIVNPNSYILFYKFFLKFLIIYNRIINFFSKYMGRNIS